MNKTKSKFSQSSIRVTACLVLCLFGYQAYATDSDPRSYSNIPVGINFLVAGYSHTAGDVAFAPSLPIKNAKINIDSAVLTYSRALDTFGKDNELHEMDTAVEANLRMNFCFKPPLVSAQS